MLVRASLFACPTLCTNASNKQLRMTKSCDKCKEVRHMFLFFSKGGYTLYFVVGFLAG